MNLVELGQFRRQYERYMKSDDIMGFTALYEKMKSKMTASTLHWLTNYVTDMESNNSIIDYSQSSMSPFGQLLSDSGQFSQLSTNTFTSPVDSNGVNNYNNFNGCCSSSAVDQSSAILKSRVNVEPFIINGSSSLSSSQARNSSNNNGNVKSTKSDQKFVSTIRNIDYSQVDPNFLKTPFKAKQIWPEWCHDMKTKCGRCYDDAFVYNDKHNDRFCVSYNGEVAYPCVMPMEAIQYECDTTMVASNDIAIDDTLVNVPPCNNNNRRSSLSHIRLVPIHDNNTAVMNVQLTPIAEENLAMCNMSRLSIYQSMPEGLNVMQYYQC